MFQGLATCVRTSPTPGSPGGTGLDLNHRPQPSHEVLPFMCLSGQWLGLCVFFLILISHLLLLKVYKSITWLLLNSKLQPSQLTLNCLLIWMDGFGINEANKQSFVSVLNFQIIAQGSPRASESPNSQQAQVFRTEARASLQPDLSLLSPVSGARLGCQVGSRLLDQSSWIHV